MIDEGNLGVWGNDECVQCGACCYDLNLRLYKQGKRKTKTCDNFEIADEKAYCTAHNEKREGICQIFFCGNFDPYIKRNCHNELRKIAIQLGTAPK